LPPANRKPPAGSVVKKGGGRSKVHVNGTYLVELKPDMLKAAIQETGNWKNKKNEQK